MLLVVVLATLSSPALGDGGGLHGERRAYGSRLAPGQLLSPLATIRASNDEVLAAFHDRARLDAQGEAEVYTIINRYTDFTGLAGAAIDGFCDRFSTAKCDEFKETFSELLRISSIRKLGRYRAERFDYLGEEIRDDEATVRSVAHYEDRALPLDYQLRRSDDGRWRVVNYTLNRVDTVQVYRKQFLRLLNQESVDDVIRRLRRKIEEYRAAE